MLTLRKLTRNPLNLALIHNATTRHITTTTTTTQNRTPAQYDDSINAAGRIRDFAAVNRLLAERWSRGCLNTSNTFRFLATADAAALVDLLLHLAALQDPSNRKHAHDALVAQLSKLHRTEDALRVAAAMVRERYGATAITFHPILNALAKERQIPAAWRVVDVMRASGIRPDVTAFNYILTANCFVGDVASAVETLERMEKGGIAADERTYDALVLGACRAGKVDAAVAVVRRMVGEGVALLPSTNTHIVKEMVRQGYYAHAVAFVRLCAGSDEGLDTEYYAFLVRRLKERRRIREARAVVEEMVERGLPVGDRLQEILSSSSIG